MGNTQELRFQGLCLKSLSGCNFMSVYDGFPELVRDRLKSSSYNLCAACVRQIAKTQIKHGLPSVPHYLYAITAMEQQLKCEEVVV